MARGNVERPCVGPSLLSLAHAGWVHRQCLVHTAQTGEPRAPHSTGGGYLPASRRRIAQQRGRMIMDSPICQTEHDFALVLSGINELTPEVENAFFDAGCDDATLSMRCGRAYLTFSRSAASIKDAILS